LLRLRDGWRHDGRRLRGRRASRWWRWATRRRDGRRQLAVVRRQGRGERRHHAEVGNYFQRRRRLVADAVGALHCVAAAVQGLSLRCGTARRNAELLRCEDGEAGVLARAVAGSAQFHLVAVGLRRQDLLPRRGWQDVRGPGGAGVQAAGEERAKRDVLVIAGNRGRRAGPARRRYPVLHPAEVRTFGVPRLRQPWHTEDPRFSPLRGGIWQDLPSPHASRTGHSVWLAEVAGHTRGKPDWSLASRVLAA